MITFTEELWIDAPPERIFGLSLDVDAHTGSMADSGERVVAGVSSGRLAPGDTVTWQARHFGVRLRMTSHLPEYRAPSYFVDEQLSGPFKRWRHEHHFTDDDGGTLMRDVITFAAPLGPLGRLAELAVLRWYMPRLIRQRNAYLKRVAES
ncbi:MULTISPECIES: SRPBCC family protein [Arthrobacter]|uniref:SRPBCC family protein n=2 Tax=Arthrobacter TaxID=1663 RepID=A0ABU9KRE4_9MICC|nr:SRPBCC family protein [Arthrobacter sp. YJM1]MDP5228003.1 SRPBCC family protein [Arthrobacter sp. YJM1]